MAGFPSFIFGVSFPTLLLFFKDAVQSSILRAETDDSLRLDLRWVLTAFDAGGATGPDIVGSWLNTSLNLGH